MKLREAEEEARRKGEQEFALKQAHEMPAQVSGLLTARTGSLTVRIKSPRSLQRLWQRN